MLITPKRPALDLRANTTAQNLLLLQALLEARGILGEMGKSLVVVRRVRGVSTPIGRPRR